MCVNLHFWDLNLGIYPPHPTNVYTCRVTIAPRVCSGSTTIIFKQVTLWSPLKCSKMHYTSKTYPHLKKRKKEKKQLISIILQVPTCYKVQIFFRMKCLFVKIIFSNLFYYNLFFTTIYKTHNTFWYYLWVSVYYFD